MKNIYCKISLIAAVSVLSTVSCRKDFLDQKPTSTLTELTYYKTVPELESGLVSCYAAVQSSYFEWDHWAVEDIGSDDADKGSTPNDVLDFTEISYSRQKSSNTVTFNLWVDCYNIIARCNKIIDKSSDTEGDAGEIAKIVEQAKFLRAMCYYHLVTAFGDVPLVIKFLNPNELNLKRTPVADIWAQIETDLNEATNLPTKSEWNQSGRITSGAVYSLLGKVYLTEKKYELANSAFDKVVQSGEYQLVPDYGKIYRKEGENCEESVFEIQHDNRIHDGSTTYDVGDWRMPRDDGSGGWGFDCPTKDLLDEFEPGDPRIIYTFMFPGDEFTGPDQGSIYTVINDWSPTGYNARKVWIPWEERANVDWFNWDMNYRYMRYAEVLLLYAESLNEVNNPNAALVLLNQVRARARNTPTTDPQRISCAYDLSFSGPILPDITTTNQSELRNAIWHEQRVELAIEGQRRAALLRTGRFKERMETAKAYAGVTVEPYELLLPIYKDEIVLSNNILIQNPGY